MARALAQAQDLLSRLALRKMGESGAKVTRLRGATSSFDNPLAVAPELSELMKYLNAM